MPIDRNELALFNEQGLLLPPTAEWTHEARLAMDAQPTLATSVNAGIPWMFTNVVDPQVVNILFTPMKGEQILGGLQRKGDWTMLSSQFPTAEVTGYVKSYGDWDKGGANGVNYNWTPRQSYAFQTMQQWGERESALFGLAGINYASELSRAAAFNMAKFYNSTLFYGVAGLTLFGMLNDPSLTTPLTPATKAATGTGWINATPTEINADMQALFVKVQTQLGGNLDEDAAMTLALAPNVNIYLKNMNSFGITVKSIFKENFPNLKLVTAPEMATGGGNLLQLYVDEVEGVDTAYGAFTERMRSHAVIPDNSGWSQKKSGGTWGTIIRRPMAIAQMLGV